MKLPIIMALAATASLGTISSCKTPLDLDTPRIDTLVAPAVKLNDILTSVSSGGPSFDTTSIPAWNYRIDTLYFSASREVNPPTVSFYTALFDTPTQMAAGGVRPIVLEQLRVRLNNVPANGTVQLTESPDKGGNGIYASALIDIAGQPMRYSTDYRQRNFTARAVLTRMPSGKLKGEIILTLRANGDHHLGITMQLDGQV